MNLVVHINSMLAVDLSTVEVKDSMATVSLQCGTERVTVTVPVVQDKNEFFPALVVDTACSATVLTANTDEYAQGNLLVLSNAQAAQINAEIKAQADQQFEHDINCLPDFDSFALTETVERDFLNDDHWPKRTDTPACLPAMRLSSSAYAFYYGQG